MTVSPTTSARSETTSKRKTLPKGKRRQFNAKVRSGCITCKKRRVKCDEEKPHCNRCTKFGTVCDGYLAPRTNAPAPYILPKSNTEETHLNAPPQHLHQHSHSIPMRHILPSNTIHVHSEPATLDDPTFARYHTSTTHHLNTIFHPSFWAKLTSPSFGPPDPSTRHGIIAIGMLSQLSRSTHSHHAHDAAGYAYALNHYDKALQGMRAAIANGQNDSRRALIACLLVFCFENLQGNEGSAIIQARSGLMLLENWIHFKRSASSSPSMAMQKEDGISEHDLMDAFAALDARVASSTAFVRWDGSTTGSDSQFGGTFEDFGLDGEGGMGGFGVEGGLEMEMDSLGSPAGSYDSRLEVVEGFGMSHSQPCSPLPRQSVSPLPRQSLMVPRARSRAGSWC